MKDTRKHMEELLKCISEGVYEKEHIVALSLLCCVAGESIFLLGPPGTAKSMVARRLKEVFVNSNAFEYLMSRFSMPDEIFGPVSITKLKDEDVYERCVDGFLPTATVVFLDEIWKAGPAIQNALLTVINERIYQNGRKVIQLPMKILIAASNELPAKDEGLEALWDRFLVRVISNCIANEKTFYDMLLQRGNCKVCVPKTLQLNDKLYNEWRAETEDILIGENILRVITEVRKRLAKAAKEVDVEELDYYISDRRWRKIVHLMKTSALLNDRNSIDYSDLLLLRHMLWNNVREIERVWKIINEALFADIETVLQSTNKDLEQILNKLPLTKSKGEEEKNFKTYSYFYYNLMGYPNARCYLYAPDYKHLKKNKDTEAILYWDKQLNAYCIRRFEGSQPFSIPTQGKVEKVMLRSLSKSISIDNRIYVIETNTPINSTPEELKIAEGCMEVIGELQQKVIQLKIIFEERLGCVRQTNLFVCKGDDKYVEKYGKQIGKQIEATEIKLINASLLVK